MKKLLLASLLSLLLPLSVLADPPEVVFQAGAKFNGSYAEPFDFFFSGDSWNQSDSGTANEISRTNDSSGSVSGNTISFNSEVTMSGDPTSDYTATATTETLVNIWVRGGANVSVSANGSGSGEWNFPATGNADLRYGTYTPWSGGDFQLDNQTGTGSDGGSDSDSEDYDGDCSPSGTTFDAWPGVVYRPLWGGAWTVTTYLDLYGIEQKSGETSGSTSLTVTLGASNPDAIIDGPYVSASPTPNPDLGDTVVVYNDSYDPDETGVDDGICTALWTITAPDGTQTQSGTLSGTSFTASMPGPWKVKLEVTDNEGNTDEDEIEVPINAPRFAMPGSGPRAEKTDQVSCEATGADESATPKRAVAKVTVGSGGGNARSTYDDPVRTRGYPLRNRVHINTQQRIPGRTTPMGNADFSYNLEVVEADLGGGTHFYVVDGDGTVLDFGSTGGSPTAEAGVYSTLSTVGGGGYELTGAGPIESVYMAGNFDYEFNSDGKLTTITDPAGNVQNLSYNGYDDLVAVTDASTGRAITFEYDTPGSIARVVENGGEAETHLTYSSGKLTQILLKDDSANVIRRVDYTYNANGLLESVKRDNDNDTLVELDYVYGGNGIYLANFTHGTGGSGFDYFAVPGAGAQHRVEKTNAKGGTEIYEYDSNFNLVKTILPTHNGGSSAPTYTYTYDANFNMLTSSNGSTTHTYTYTGLGKVATYSDGTGTWTYGYSGVDLTSVSDSIGTLYTLAYTDTNNPHHPTTITDADSDVWTYAYNTYGQLTSITPPSGAEVGTTTITYEENSMSPNYGYTKTITNGAGDVVTFNSYTSLGDLTSVSTSPTGGVTNTYTFEYDAQQRLVTVTHPDSKTYERTYTGANLTQETDEAGTDYDYEYCPHCGAMTEFAGPLTKTLNWEVDDDFDTTEFSDARSKVTEYQYGYARELKKVLYPDSTYKDYEYDNYGRLDKLTSKPNNTTRSANFIYNSTGRLDEIDFSYYKTVDIEYTYNSDGTVASVDHEAGTTSYTYTDDRLVETITYDYSVPALTNDQIIEYTYYPDNLVHTVTWKDDTTTVASWTYTYDGAGRVETITNSYGEVTEYDYDGEGKLTDVEFDNATYLEYTYNQQTGWPTAIEYTNGGGIMEQYSLVYDDGYNTVGNLTDVTEYSTDTMEYEYDALYRLTSETRTGTGSYSHDYEYDLAGNLTTLDSSAFATYDDANKFSSLSIGTYEYDSDGNMRRFAGSGLPTTYNTWDVRGKIISTVISGTTIAWEYDHRGLRVSRRGGIPNRYYIFAGSTLIGEIHGTTPAYAYTWGPDGIVSQRDIANTESYWYQFGPQGETRALVDDSASTVETYLYDAYGIRLSGSPTLYNPFKYGGKFGYYSEDTAFGRILAGQRWYSPEHRRWISRDPIEYGGGDNWYEYAGGNPVNRVDPDGLDWFDDLVNGAAGLGDGVSLGTTDDIREAIGGNRSVDKGSAEYEIARAVGTGIAVAIPVAKVCKWWKEGWRVRAWRYHRTGGGGVQVVKNGKRKVAVDIHKWHDKGKKVPRYKYPHVHLPSKPKKHWPWQR